MRDGWVETPIGDVAEVLSGFAFKSELFNKSEGIPLIRIRDLPKRNSTEAFYSGSYEDRYVVKRGDFLIGMDGEFHCYEWNGPDALLNQRVCRIQDFKIGRVVPRYIYFAVNQYLDKIEKDTGYTTVKHISAKQVLGIKIPLAPLPEQKRIVDLISSLDSYIEALKRQLESAKRSRNAVLHELLTAGGEGWVETKLGLIAEFVMGQAPLGARCNKAGIGTPFVKAGEFGDNRPEIVEWTTDPLKMAKQSDVLVCVVGATAGKINLGADCAIGRSVAAVRPGQKLHQFYLYYLLSLELSNLRSGSRGSAQGVITKDDLFRIPVSLPSINEQVEIVSIISSIDAFTDQISLSMKLVKNLRSGLLSDLLSGQHEIPLSYDKVIGAV